MVLRGWEGRNEELSNRHGGSAGKDELVLETEGGGGSTI